MIHVSKYKTAILSSLSTVALLAVACSTGVQPANAQYIVMDAPNSNPDAIAFHNELRSTSSYYVQDYNHMQGVNCAADNEVRQSSIDVLNGFFDGYLGIFAGWIGVPALIIAALRLFVSKNTGSQKGKRKSFELPAAPNASRYYRPSMTAKNMV